MKNLKTKTQKGFSLVELMVVIAIIAILAAVAIPMYSNYTTRANLGAELSKLGSVKTEIAEGIANNNGSASGVTVDAANRPSGVTVADGVITDSNVSSIVSGASLTLTPTVASGAITWACNISGVSSSQAPNNCTVS
ncbi:MULTISPECIES: pilin [unclassified Francisella]|uniref:pilin n=1 Tax=unclassified Francisella TaxID=2610885 RepID=UPI002E331DEE|nr:MULTISPECIES: prepilin-type N-terminal cleavage/methylation domain-containing protein [unclassified Francisella]MED7818691.1 prepilin-type N-terminal cleavage/methylation domain-containing protein [Francisella sp. 19S2-4]MED7829592.1 prepilin-type N-terminal cleavage/methylation domain-containing protein [Francisella sp. 19S2-10]